MAKASVRHFLGEGLVDDALRSRVQPSIGNRIKPPAKLDIEIVKIARHQA